MGVLAKSNCKVMHACLSYRGVIREQKSPEACADYLCSTGRTLCYSSSGCFQSETADDNHSRFMRTWTVLIPTLAHCFL